MRTIIATPATTPITIPAIAPPDSLVPDDDADDGMSGVAEVLAGRVWVEIVVVVKVESTLKEFIALDAFLLSNLDAHPLAVPEQSPLLYKEISNGPSSESYSNSFPFALSIFVQGMEVFECSTNELSDAFRQTSVHDFANGRRKSKLSPSKDTVSFIVASSGRTSR